MPPPLPPSPPDLPPAEPPPLRVNTAKPRRAGRELRWGLGVFGGIVLVAFVVGQMRPDKAQPPAPVAVDTRSAPERYMDRLDSAEARGDDAEATRLATMILRDYPSSTEAHIARDRYPDLVDAAAAARRQDDREPKMQPASPAQQPAPAASVHPVAVNLATIETGHRANPSDPMVSTIVDLLTSLDALYPENQQEIGDMTARAYQILRDEGRQTSVTQILREMRTAATNERGQGYAHGQTYADMLAGYLALRASGTP